MKSAQINSSQRRAALCTLQRIEVSFDLGARAERALQQFSHAINELSDVDGLELELLTPREGEHALRRRFMSSRLP